MKTTASKQALRQNEILFWANLSVVFIFMLAVFLVFTVHNSILSDFSWAEFLRVVGGAFSLYKAAHFFSKEAAKCRDAAFEMALLSWPAEEMHTDQQTDL